MINKELINYERIVSYARMLCFSYHLPECEVMDIAHSAYVDSLYHTWQTNAGNNETALANRIMYTAVIKAMRHRGVNAEQMLTRASEIRVAEGEDEEVADSEANRNTVVVHDDGVGADKARYADDWENPQWLQLFNREKKKLYGKERKLVLLLLKDSRLALARGKMKLSKYEFMGNLKKIKVRFTPIFRAYCEHRGKL